MHSKKPLLVFSCYPEVPPPSSLPIAPTCPAASHEHSQLSPIHILSLPIALRKDKHFTTTHPISRFIFYEKLNSLFCLFGLSLFYISIPRSLEESVLAPSWQTHG